MTVAARGLAGGLMGLAVALLLAGRARTGAGTRRVAAGSAARRVAATYNSSASGARLAVALRMAAIGATPMRWRTAQLSLVPPLAMLVAAATGSLITGASVAVATIRWGGAGMLRSWRGRRSALVEEAAQLLAERLGTELHGSAGAATAVALVARDRGVRDHPAAGSLATALGARVAAGMSCGEALAALAALEPPGKGQSSLATVAAVAMLALDGGRGGADLERLAAGMAVRRRAEAQARAITAEVRVAATAIPVLVGALAVVLGATQPGVATAVVTMPTLPLAAVFAGVSVAGTVAVRRLSRT